MDDKYYENALETFKSQKHKIYPGLKKKIGKIRLRRKKYQTNPKLIIPKCLKYS